MICDKCLHANICGNEGEFEEALTYCADFLCWIPVSERLPEDIKPVIVTWKNTDPKSYYQYIVGKHFIGTAHYKSGKWYWYSSVTEDLLAEYGKCDSEEFDEAIEVVAWMPLPEPYMAESEETETWNGIHAQITAPKGTFERIFNDADDDNDI